MDGYDDNEYQSMCQYISSDEFIVWMVQRENVYEQLRYVIGPEDPRDAKSKYPQSIRAYYGLDKIRNAVYFSPNEHIYNHQVGIFFFQDEKDENDGASEIPRVPESSSNNKTQTQTTFDYINTQLNQYASQQQLQQQQQMNNELVSDTVGVGDDEYALVLLSSIVTANTAILETIKSRITQNRFIIVDHLASYLPPTIVSEMFNDGYSSFSSDGPPIPKEQFDKLLDTFGNGEILALHVCRQNGYMLLDQLRVELEKYNLTTSTYITLSLNDYKSKCAHFFDSAESDNDDDMNDNKSVISKLAPTVQINQHSKASTEASYDNNERAIVIFKPNISEEQKDDIRKMFLDEMLHVFDETQTYIPRKTLTDLLNHEGYDEYYMDQLCEFMAGHALEAWLVKGENVYKELMLIVGPEDSDIARIQAPNSIRAKYGVDKIQNVLYFTKSKEIFEKTHRYFFFDEPENTQNHDSDSQSSHSQRSHRSRQNKQLTQQFDEFETKSVLTATNPPLIESDEEQRAILVLQHYLNDSEIDSIRVILDNKDIDIIQEKTFFLPLDTYQVILQFSHPNWNSNKINQIATYYNKDQCTAFLMAKANIFKLLDKIVGNENPLLADDGTIRQLFGVDELKNSCFFTRNSRAYKAIVDELFFDQSHQSLHNNHHMPNGTTIAMGNVSAYSTNLSVHSVKSNRSAGSTHNGMEKSILVFKPHMNRSDIEQIQSMILQNGLHIIQQKTCYLPSEVWYLCMKDEVADDAHLAIEAQHLSSSAITAYLILGTDAFDKLADLAGPAEPRVAKLHMPQSIRALYGVDEVKNCVWWSKNSATYKRIFHKFFFSEKIPQNLNTLLQQQQSHNSYSNSYDNRSENSPSVSSRPYSTSKYKPAAKSETISISSSIRSTDKTLLIIKPHISAENRVKIKDMLVAHGITIIQAKETHLAKESCIYLLKSEGIDESYVEVLAVDLNKGEMCAMLITKEGIFNELKDIVGPSDPSIARKTNPNSIRALYGKDIVRNCVYYTKSKRHYKKVFSFFFFEDKSEHQQKPQQQQQINNNYNNYNYNNSNNTNNYNYSNNYDTQSDHTSPSVSSRPYSTSKYKPAAKSETMSISSSIRSTDKTLLIIKPHISAANRVKITDMLVAHGITIIQQKETHLAKESCKYLLKSEGIDESYVSVLANDLNNGEMCALLISKEGIFNELKEIVGPSDPSVARKTNPNSIRALYGKDIVRNCVYYTKSKRHYKKVFSFFFFEDVSEQPIDELDEADNSNSNLLNSNTSANGMQYNIEYKSENNENETMSVTSYGYQDSHNYYNSCAPCAVMIIKPHAMDKQLEIEKLLQSHDISILCKRSAAIHAEAIYGFLKSNQTFQSLNKQIMNLIIEDMCAGDVCVYCLGDATNKSFQKVEQGLHRIQEIGKIISAKFGLDQIRNAIYCSRDMDEMRKQRKFFFLDSVFFQHESIEDSHQYSFMIVRPNAFQFRNKIIQLLKSKEFAVVVNKRMKQGMQLSVAQQFFYPYFGTHDEFDEFCESMTRGQWAIIMVSRVGNCINALRQFTEQIQSMYSGSDDRSIASRAIYVTNCETDFWRDRAFFFFNDDSATQFTDNGSVNNSKQRKKKNNKLLSSVSSQRSVHTQLSESFALNPIEETILLIKPHATKYARDIERFLMENGFLIAKSRPMNMPTMVWEDFYRKYENKAWFDELCSAMAEDQIISYILYRVNAISYLRTLIGPSDPQLAKSSAPKSLRAMYGIDEIHNAFHCSDSEESVIKERSELFFENVTNNNNTHNKLLSDRIFVIIKPAAATLYGDNIRTHLVGAGGYEIVKEKVVHLSQTIYMNLYLDISDELFSNECEYLASDQVIIMILEKLNGYRDIVDIIGHRDPNIALSQQPGSIRAIYGKDIIQNAIEASSNKEIYLQNYDVFFDDDADNFSDTHSYKLLKAKTKDKKLRLIQLQRENKKEKCLLIIKPHINCENVNYMKQMLINLEFEIMSEKRTNLPYDEFIDAFENDYENNSDLDAICREWCSGEITIFILSKLHAFQTIKTLVGPNDPEIARSEAPNSIRANFGIDRIRNCCWYSKNKNQYQLKLQSFDF